MQRPQGVDNVLSPVVVKSPLSIRSMLCVAKLPTLFSFLFSLFTGKCRGRKRREEKREERREKSEEYKKKKPLTRLFLFGGSGWIRTTVVDDNRFTVCPLWPLGNTPLFTWRRRNGGAGGRIRTPDLLITNQLLYRLSYTSLSPDDSYTIAHSPSFVKMKFPAKQEVFSAAKIAPELSFSLPAAEHLDEIPREEQKEIRDGNEH